MACGNPQNPSSQVDVDGALVLSDVHVRVGTVTCQYDAEELKMNGIEHLGPCGPYTLCQSEFTFAFPVSDDARSSCGDQPRSSDLDSQTCSAVADCPEKSPRQLVDVDEDGDFIVCRLSQHHHSKTVSIQHTMSTSIHDVGLQVWPGALVLCDYIISKLQEFQGCRLLELGCGPGLVGIIAAVVGVKTVICTDLPEVLSLCQQNFDANQTVFSSSTVCLVHSLDWTSKCGEFLPASSLFGWREEDICAAKLVDFIVASDVVYDENLTESFFRWLHFFLSVNPTAIALVASEKRINFSAQLMAIASPAHEHFEECCQQLVNCNCDMHLGMEFRVVNVPLDFASYSGTPHSPLTTLTQFSIHSCVDSS